MSFYKLHRRPEKSDYNYALTTRKHFKMAIENPDMWTVMALDSMWIGKTMHVSLGEYMRQFERALRSDIHGNRDFANFEKSIVRKRGDFVHLHFDPALEKREVRIGDSDEVLDFDDKSVLDRIRQMQKEHKAQLEKENQS